MYKEAIRPVWAEINLSNLDYNIKNIKAKLGSGTKIIGVVKADGYGHGSVKVRFSEQMALTRLPYQRFRRLSF